jgi:hypothetical protein
LGAGHRPWRIRDEGTSRRCLAHSSRRCGPFGGLGLVLQAQQWLRDRSTAIVLSMIRPAYVTHKPSVNESEIVVRIALRVLS